MRRFVAFAVASLPLLTAANTRAAIVIDPLTFKIRQSEGLAPGAMIARQLSNSASHDLFHVSRGRQAARMASGAMGGLQTGATHSGRALHLASGLGNANAPGVSQGQGKGHQEATSPDHNLQLARGSTPPHGPTGIPDVVPFTPDYGFWPSGPTLPTPHEGSYSHDSRPDRLVTLGEQPHINNIPPAPVALDALAAPEPATALIWTLGVALTTCVAARRRISPVTDRS